MCDPVTLFGASAAGIAGGGAAVGGISTVGLLGSSGAFSLATGSLTSGLYSSVASMNFGTAFNLVGAGTRAYGAAYAGAVQKSNYEYQASMMAYNKKISENNALLAQQSAEFDADTFDLNKRRLLSQQNVGYAKSGVVINQDTPLNVSADTVSEAQLERLAILYKGEIQSDSYLQKAQGQEAASQRYLFNAETATKSASIGAVTELAKGAYSEFRYTPRGPGSSLLTG
tara:strand:+ start:714 stop:1397 length:684 start_codon:yes stop_codon:yes gene_type:complete